jgi:hypothetical protein
MELLLKTLKLSMGVQRECRASIAPRGELLAAFSALCLAIRILRCRDITSSDRLIAGIFGRGAFSLGRTVKGSSIESDRCYYSAAAGIR